MHTRNNILSTFTAPPEIVREAKELAPDTRFKTYSALVVRGLVLAIREAKRAKQA